MPTSKKRDGNIEFLRLIFSIIIIFHHATIEKIPFMGGYLCVEFFFIISGYYLAVSISKKSTYQNSNEIFYEAINYVVRRIKSIFPYIFISTIIGYFVLFYTYDWVFSWDQIALIISDFLFLQSFGLPTASFTGIIWYLSSMFIGLLILYPLTRKNFDVFSKYIAPMITLFIMGYLVRTFGNFNVPANYVFGWICSGNLRAISMISLGIFLYHPVKYLQNVCFLQNKHIQQVINTIIAIVLYGVVITYMFFWKNEIGQYDALIVIIGATALAISLSGQTITFKIFDNPFYIFVGKFSVALFVSHFYWVQNINNIFIKLNLTASNAVIGITGLILTFITAFIVLWLSNMLKKVCDIATSKSSI